MNGKRILLADDEFSARIVMRDRLVVEGFETLEAESGEEAVQVFTDNQVDLVLMDVNFEGGMDGFEATRRIKELSDSRFVPVILCTVRDNVKSKEIGLESGADDYITKPFDLTELVVRVRSMLRIQELSAKNTKLKKSNLELQEREKELKQENQDLRNRLLWPDWEEPIIGSSSAMQSVFRLIEKFAPSSETVLITGETGVGKELTARLIHQNSSRRDKPLLTLDCPSVPDQLFEAELFGHKKGSFSGAHIDRTGILIEGDGGTVFLDEIGELPLLIQSKLLRFLEDNAVRPIGTNLPRKVDVRIIAATNRNLEEMIELGEFRRDLFFRLSVLRIVVPSLGQRPEDIPALVQSFIAQFNKKNPKHITGFTSQALREIERANYVGNVRQLKNIVTFSAILAPDQGLIDSEHLTEAMAHYSSSQTSGQASEKLSSITQDAERQAIIECLERYHHDRTQTAKALGITRQGLWKKMKRLGLQDEQ